MEPAEVAEDAEAEDSVRLQQIVIKMKPHLTVIKT